MDARTGPNYGTDAQKAHYLPRLADGRDLPCFGLTSPYAGSDAASIPDRGVLVERQLNGRAVRDFVVNFHKRYITLAPVATVVGLAFHAVDPGRPEGEQELGITCALVPVPTEGMTIGSRHRPMDSAFMNGPIRGKGERYSRHRSAILSPLSSRATNRRRSSIL